MRKITKKIEKKPRKKLLKRKIVLGLNTIRSCFLLWLHDKKKGGVNEIYKITNQE
jgi:hypothetical protein